MALGMVKRFMTSAMRSHHLASLLLFVCLVAIVWIGVPGDGDVARAGVGRGIVEYRLERPGLDPQRIPGLVTEMGPGRLGARWTRVLVQWATLQPEPPGVSWAGDADGDGYSDAYLDQLDAVVAALHAARIRTILTPISVPEWASDSRYWTAEGYDPDVVLRVADPVALGAFRTLATRLAGRYAGRADHFEVWNEPNLGSGIYPQLVGRRVVGPAVYVKMLKAFHDGAKLGNRKAVIIAGATSRRGSNNDHSTTPQWFATYLKARGAARWFDAYSHHPYTPPNSPAQPNRPPNMPRRAVTLGNIATLLQIFPRKPFYLTEFGYSTGTADLFCVRVSQADQARYMRQAFALMARHRQVKALLWFLVTDFAPRPAEPEWGIFSGLVEPDDVTRKPAWYAFAGHNQLTTVAPRSVARGVTFSVQGALTTKLGPEIGVPLRLQARRARGPWRTVAFVAAGEGGAFRFEVRQTASRRYRVVWDGVCESPALIVRTP